MSRTSSLSHVFSLQQDPACALVLMRNSPFRCSLHFRAVLFAHRFICRRVASKRSPEASCLVATDTLRETLQVVGGRTCDSELQIQCRKTLHEKVHKGVLKTEKKNGAYQKSLNHVTDNFSYLQHLIVASCKRRCEAEVYACVRRQKDLQAPSSK